MMASTSTKEAELVHLLTRNHDDCSGKETQDHHKHSARHPIRFTVLNFVITGGLLCGFFLLGRWSRTSHLAASGSPRTQGQGLSSADLSSIERTALEARFGERDWNVSQVLSVPAQLVKEVHNIWPDLQLPLAPHFITAYAAERQREAVLWSFFVAFGDDDGSEEYSYQERQNMLHRLSGEVDGKNLRIGDTTVDLRDCFARTDFFTYQGDTSKLVTPQYLFRWIAFANPGCGDLLLREIATSSFLQDYVVSHGLEYGENTDCILGGTDQYWKEADFTWPECESEIDMSNEAMVHSLLRKYL